MVSTLSTQLSWGCFKRKTQGHGLRRLQSLQDEPVLPGLSEFRRAASKFELDQLAKKSEERRFGGLFRAWSPAGGGLRNSPARKVRAGSDSSPFFRRRLHCSAACRAGKSVAARSPMHYDLRRSGAAMSGRRPTHRKAGIGREFNTERFAGFGCIF